MCNTFVAYIDRASIRKNPNKTGTYYISGRVRYSGSMTELLSPTHHRVSRFVCDGFSPSREPINPTVYSYEDNIGKEKLSPDGLYPHLSSLDCEMTRDIQPVYSHPSGDYLYEHLDPDVTCSECLNSFKADELSSESYPDGEGGDGYMDNVCPHCHAGYCCSIAYERLSDIPPEEVERLASENEAKVKNG